MAGTADLGAGSPRLYLGVGIENCWMAQHDPRIRPGKRLLDVHLQMQHYQHWREDLGLAADLGINAIRYSVPWYRANPAPGRYDWSWIEGPVGWLREHGITPIMDLIHYGAPLWMERECLDPSFPERLAEYAAAFAAHFAGSVDHYTPFNEPQTLAKKAGYLGLWPPYASGLDGWLKATLAIARAMVLASEALRRTLPAVKLVSADNPWAPPADELRQACGEACAPPDAGAGFLWTCLASSLAYGLVEPDGPDARCLIALGCRREDLAWFRERAGKPDLLGYNYYCYGVPEEEGPALDREVDKMVAECVAAQAHFGLPLYISETSGGRNDAQKLQWVRALEKVLAVMRGRGVPVVGLNWWPLYETIQWDYRDNGKPTAECIRPGGWNNGLYTIRPQPDGGLERVKTAAVAAYAGLLARLKSSDVPPALG